MVLAPGARLGSYEVVGLIGEGGMGEVYRATDTSLKRQVAIKVLPASVAADPDRLARFQREAEVLASLNHPNIAAIYGLDRSGSRPALVMELVEGATLADRIARGPVPLAEALPIAKQIAEALEAAHEQGIVHRDLKPANVKVRADETVKVLDFGLAKALEPAVAVPANPTMLPTITTPALTQMGLILGTAAYMSPEQARGKPVDKRTDIWAFGCVLFEMLSGTRPFGGEDVAEVLGAVIHKPIDWTPLPPATPPDVRTVLERCLERDVRQRVRDMGDVRLALAGLFVPAGSQGAGPSPGAPRSRPAMALVVATAALLAATIGAAGAWLVRAPAPSATVAFTVDTPLTANPNSFALSPDGRRLAFTAADEGVQMLWIRDIGSTTARVIPGTDQAAGPFWSPDSRRVAFFAANLLRQVVVDGGAPRTVTETATTVTQGGTWSDDDTILFSRVGAGILRVPIAGGTPQPVTTPQSDETHAWPVFLPDNRHFLYVKLRQSGPPQLMWRALDGPDERVIGMNRSRGWYSPTGHLVYYSEVDEQVLAQRFDAASGTVTGETIPIAGRLWSATQNRAALSLSPAGVLAYRTGEGNVGLAQLTWLDRRGTVLSTVGEPADYRNLAVDAFGERVVANSAQGDEDVWLFDQKRGTRSRLTFVPLPDSDPVFSPDGGRLAFYSARNPPGIYLKAASGGGADELAAPTGYQTWPRDWSSDGRFLLYQDVRDLWILPLEGDRKPFPYVATPAQEQDGRFSPDAKWIAYSSEETGRFEVFVQDFPARGAKFQVSTAGGSEPRWRHDGREIFYLGADGQLIVVSVETSPAFKLGVPTPVFQTSLLNLPVPAQRRYAVSADGQKFLMNVPVGGIQLAPVTVIVNWQRALDGR